MDGRKIYIFSLIYTYFGDFFFFIFIFRVILIFNNAQHTTLLYINIFSSSCSSFFPKILPFHSFHPISQIKRTISPIPPPSHNTFLFSFFFQFYFFSFSFVQHHPLTIPIHPPSNSIIPHILRRKSNSGVFVCKIQFYSFFRFVSFFFLFLFFT